MIFKSKDIGNCCLLAINHFVIAISIVIIMEVLKVQSPQMSYSDGTESSLDKLRDSIAKFSLGLLKLLVYTK